MVKLAGNDSVMVLRARVTVRSSNGWRSISSTLRANSGSSSRKSTPLCARLTSPGRGMPEPPPISPASDTVWCGARRGLCDNRPAPRGSRPATLWICVVSSASWNVSGGRMPANRFASIDLPEPGGPIIRTLWPPAAATSRARLAVAWPRTSQKSGTDSSGRQRPRVEPAQTAESAPAL